MYKNREEYIKHIESIREKTGLSKAIIVSDKVLTLSGFIMYPVLLIYLFFTQRESLLTFILLPAIFFMTLSFLRKKINSPRPYELYKSPALVDKDTKGCSFPSRHVFSLAMIAVLWTGVLRPVGIILLAGALLLALLRVVMGVHFPKDVAAGLVIGILCGLVTLIY